MPFETARSVVDAFEGLYSNNPKDPGGETYCGIARKKHPSWPGWSLIDAMTRVGNPVEKTTELATLVDKFYKDNFWTALKCDQIDAYSSTIAGELFEASVNCGPGNGVKFLQRALNILNSRGKLYPELTVDGVMGSNTLSAVITCLKHRPASLLYRCQNGEQYLYYREWSGVEDFPGVFKRT